MTDTPVAPRIRRRERLAIRGPLNENRGGALPPELTPRRDALDAEIDRALADGRPVDMSVVYPEPPPAAPGENLQAHRPVPVDDTDAVPGAIAENMSPQDRLRRVGVIAPTYLDEYRSRLLHRLLMRRLPLDVIANQMGCSVRMVQVMKTKLKKRLARQAQHMNVYDIAGETLGFYNEVRAIAMRQADTAIGKDKHVALRTALEAQNDAIRFLSASGFFEAAPFVPDQSKQVSPEQQGVDQTLSMLAAVLSSETSVDNIEGFFDSPNLDDDDGLDYDGMDPNTDLL